METPNQTALVLAAQEGEQIASLVAFLEPSSLSSFALSLTLSYLLLEE